MRLLSVTPWASLTLLAPLAAGCGSASVGDGMSMGRSDAGPDGSSLADLDGSADLEGSADSPPEADVNTNYPAFRPFNPPQVVTGGGPVMKAPKIVPVFFSTDDPTLDTSIADFVAKVGETAYWKAAVTEYRAGAAVGLPPIHLTAADDPPATIDDSAIQSWLAAKLNADDPAFPKADENTIYLLFYPPGVTVTLNPNAVPGSDAGAPPNGDGGDAGDVGDGDTSAAEAAPGDAPAGDAPAGDAMAGDAMAGADAADMGNDGGASDGGGEADDGGESDDSAGDSGPPDAGAGAGLLLSCDAFGGYHQNITLDANHGSIDVAYAVVPRCDPFNGLTGIDAVTGGASHELLEATTDPFPLDTPGYVQVDEAHFYWETTLGGGEIGDMCAGFAGSFTKFDELDYTVQRTWSNRAESAGQDPCVPALPNEVYFNSAPVLKDTIPVSFMGETIDLLGAHIPAGTSQTVELDLFSTGPTSGPWTVTARDLAALSGQPAQLQFTFDKTSGMNGDKIQMTIQVVSAPRRNRETFVIQSSLNGQRNVWLGFVGN